MRTKTFLLISGLLFTINSFAQISRFDPGQEYTDRMDYIFEHVDKSKITTGLLSDYGLHLIEPDYFDGVPADSNYVDMDTWKMLYLGMATSKINKFAKIASPDTVFAVIDKMSYRSSVPVAIMHFEYNSFRENAVSLGLVSIVNDQIIENTTSGDNLKRITPYLTKQLFAVAPKELYFDGPSVSFVFMQDLFYTNTDKTVSKYEISFNNGLSYLTSKKNMPITYIFTSAGMKTIYFRVSYTDGTSYTSQTNIMVKNSANILMATNSSSLYDSVMIAATSQHSGGKIQIKYSTYNYSGTIKKPLIVAEGFDPSIIMGEKTNMDINDFIKRPIPYLTDTTTVGTINIPYSGYRNLYNDIDYEQYDIIYLDYNNGVDDIWRNAQLFREVIEWVNTNKDGNKPNVVMGISMGGLVARIALRKMELAGVNHQTWKYISVDSPHKGANVPLGFQSFIRHIQRTDLHLLIFSIDIKLFDYTNITKVQKVVDLINSPAVKQMLIYTINSNYGLDNSIHNNFQSQYDQLGFPQQCINVSISNGSNAGNLIFPAGSKLFDLHMSASLPAVLQVFTALFGAVSNYPQLILNIIPGKSQLKIDIGINALKNKTASELYSGKIYIYKKILWLIPVNITVTSKKINSTSAMLPVDGAPGGIYDIKKIAGKLPFDDNAIKQQQFCFIPAVSSLALSDWETKLTQPVSASTEFDYMYAQSLNELHTRFNSSAKFLYDHLTGGYFEIAGANNIYSLQQVTYTIAHLPAGTTVTWSGSSNVNIISGQGTSQVTISVCSDYTATLTATLSGTIDKILTKNIAVKAGDLHVYEYLNYVDVWLNNPYAQCYDWKISNSFYSDYVGTGDITCSSYNDLLLYPSGEDAYGSIYVRARNGNCVSSWEGASFSIWRPVLSGYFNPLRPEPFYATVEDIPFPMINGAEFSWYFDNHLFAVTSEPYIQSWDWPCGDHEFYVVVTAGGIESLPGSASFWGMCGGGSGGWGVSSAYPNPASSELTIDRIEENGTEATALNTQSAKVKVSNITVLLYSHSTTQLVYNKTYSSSEKQIKIDT
ncbi:MAG: hypothetical protein LBK94_08070, partial [Prevotellaceae bacterium]|nr:hypothetical protein [Prevotellaceae bacterium]